VNQEWYIVCLHGCYICSSLFMRVWYHVTLLSAHLPSLPLFQQLWPLFGGRLIKPDRSKLFYIPQVRALLCHLQRLLEHLTLFLVSHFCPLIPGFLLRVGKGSISLPWWSRLPKIWSCSTHTLFQQTGLRMYSTLSRYCLSDLKQPQIRITLWGLKTKGSLGIIPQARIIIYFYDSTYVRT
jgi:hypothetical protein